MESGMECNNDSQMAEECGIWFWKRVKVRVSKGLIISYWKQQGLGQGGAGEDPTRQNVKSLRNKTEWLIYERVGDYHNEESDNIKGHEF